MSKRSYLLIMVLAVVAMALAACPAAAPAGDAGSGDAGDAAMAEPVVLEFNLGTEPPSLDPSLGSDSTSIDVINEMFLGLTELDPDTMEAIPALATSWETNEDQSVWTFTMRDDVPWVKYNVGHRRSRAGDGRERRAAYGHRQ